MCWGEGGRRGKVSNAAILTHSVRLDAYTFEENVPSPPPAQQDCAAVSVTTARRRKARDDMSISELKQRVG
jgi:hypothetical protein